MYRLRRSAASLAVILAVVSCREQVDYEPVRKGEIWGGIALAVKSSDSFGELTAMAFDDEAGDLIARASGSGDSLSLSVPKDATVDFRVAANVSAGTFSSVADRDGFLSRSVLLSECRRDALPAAGGLRAFCGGRQSFVVEMRNLLSRVTLDKVSPDFVAALGRGAEVVFNGVYLINVCGEVGFSEGYECNLWLNQSALEEDLPPNPDALLHSRAGLRVKDNSPIQVGAILYCCPNRVSNGVNSAVAPQWSPRNTRLVIEFEVNGARKYYPVTLPSMERGTEYRIGSVSLVGEGSGNPDIPVDGRMFFDHAIEVVPWGENSFECQWF